jgi:hypothetical protein
MECGVEQMFEVRVSESCGLVHLEKTEILQVSR